MNFVKITDDYIVNIENIFSLERRIIEEEKEKYAKDLIDSIIKDWPVFDCDGEMYSPKNDDNPEENPLCNIYFKKMEDFINEKIQKKKKKIYKYYIILCTGVTVQLSKSKFDEIMKKIM